MEAGVSRFSFLLFFIFIMVPASSFAESAEEMQRRLNEQVMQKPFSVEDQSRIDAFMKDAMKKNLEPVKTPPKYWRPGYTCDSIRGYGWRAYSDCAYHHHYYGHYW